MLEVSLQPEGEVWEKGRELAARAKALTTLNTSRSGQTKDSCGTPRRNNPRIKSLRTGHGTDRDILAPKISVDRVVRIPEPAIPEVHTGAAGCSAVCGRPTIHAAQSWVALKDLESCCPDPEDSRDFPVAEI